MNAKLNYKKSYEVTRAVCRDGKSTEEEIKAWQFWHQRQHSVSILIVLIRASRSNIQPHTSQCSYINESKLYEYLSSPLHFNCLCCH